MVDQNTPISVQKKKKSPGGHKKKRASQYNIFMSAEQNRLKSIGIEPGKERRARALVAYHEQKNEQNSKPSSSSASGSSP